MNRRIRRRIQCRIYTFPHKCTEVGPHRSVPPYTVHLLKFVIQGVLLT